jgi:alpha-tubulin suppressor-like RCC1 family protein
MPVPNVTNAVAVSAGHDHACALTKGGAVYCWGRDSAGETGDPSKGDAGGPYLVIAGHARSVAAAQGYPQGTTDVAHTCALTDDGGVLCWGNATNSTQCCDAPGGGTPARLANLPGPASAAVVGYFNTCAIANGSAACCGTNFKGVIGNTSAGADNVNPPVSPQFAPGFGTVAALAFADYHACAMNAGGDVACWGENGGSQDALCTGTQTDEPTPTPTLLPKAAKLFVNYHNSCVITATGEVDCCGNDSHGQISRLAIGASLATPVKVATGVDTMCVGWNHVCLLSAGALMCQGWNEKGQLGGGTLGDNAAIVRVTFSP